MTPAGREIWNSAAGGSLMAAMLKQAPMTPNAQQALNELKALNAKAARERQNQSDLKPVETRVGEMKIQLSLFDQLVEPDSTSSKARGSPKPRQTTGDFLRALSASGVTPSQMTAIRNSLPPIVPMESPTKPPLPSQPQPPRTDDSKP